MSIGRLKVRQDPAAVSPSPRRPFSVERLPEHQQAEQLLASLRRRRKEAADRVDGMMGMSEAKSAAAAEHDRLNREIEACLRALAPMRAKHLQNVRVAFRAPRRDAAQRAIAALKEAEEAIGEINAMSAELRRLGSHNPDLLASQVLPFLILPLEKLAREKREAS